MDPATIATITATTRTVIKYGSQIWDYIRDDQTAKLGLLQPIRITVEGPGVGIGDFRSDDGIFTMLSSTINRIDFRFLPFPPDQKSIWNGPDFLPNNREGGSLPSSLPHDFVCYYRPQIAAELSLTENEVWVWSSGILSTVWEYYGGANIRTSGESWIAYHITRNARRPYQWLRRRFGFVSVIIGVALISGCNGCSSRPDWHVTYADPVISIERGIVTTNTPPATIAP